MIVILLYWFSCYLVTTPAFTSAANNTWSSCYLDEFACAGGTCVGWSTICDGRIDCPDGSDELNCNGFGNPISEPELTWSRTKRQVSSCLANQWRCRDGTCIGFDGRCDGIVDCPDNSDESFPLCRKNVCQNNLFKCTYGACVDGTAPCNGVRDCVDNSDELLPSCRNDTSAVEVGGQFKCKSGQVIPATDRCDGVPNCSDGSDEILEACVATECLPFLFRCAYGACVDLNADCNGKQECADGSDESDELCNRIGSETSLATINLSGLCILPPYPKNGGYSVSNDPRASPGRKYVSVLLNITCNDGYMPEDRLDAIWCFDGAWSAVMPKCVRFCRLAKDVSVKYRCSSRECFSFEPAGTIVDPVCEYPNYYYRGILQTMKCQSNGHWNRIVRCEPDCGRTTPVSKPLVLGGREAEKGELPWHAGIYIKDRTPYMHICGGSLISNTVIISAAHCFWSDTSGSLISPSMFAVAVGKIYRRWNNNKDEDAQKSDVEDIRITPLYNSARTNYQDDIALVRATTPFTYFPHIRPVCLDFGTVFEDQQLQAGSLGKVAGWGLTSANGTGTSILKVVEMPVISVAECRRMSPDNFRVHLTSDKFCAGYTNGTTLCQGDSGGGLAFPVRELGRPRYYLRGLVSVASTSNDACTSDSLVTFTKITKHEDLITNYLE